MNRAHCFFLVTAASLVVFGCVSAPKQSPASTESFLTGSVWLLAGYSRESGFVPLEPGHGSSAKIVLKADGSFEGTTGWSIFSGTWKAGRFGSNNQASASFSPADFQSKADSTASEQFEQDIILAFQATRFLQRGSSAIRLLNRSGQPVLDFIALNPSR